jgi:hypothetical protein
VCIFLLYATMVDRKDIVSVCVVTRKPFREVSRGMHGSTLSCVFSLLLSSLFPCCVKVEECRRLLADQLEVPLILGTVISRPSIGAPQVCGLQCFCLLQSSVALKMHFRFPVDLFFQILYDCFFFFLLRLCFEGS